MKHIFIALLSLLFATTLYAQQFEVISPLMHSGSVPSNDTPLDNNGNPCAKIVVELPYSNVEITGVYIIGKIQKKTGRYELFVATPKKEGQKITLRHDSIPSFDIPLWLNGALIGREAYNVKLQVLSESVTSNPLYGSLNVTSNPEGAKVFVNDNEVGLTPCSVNDLMAGNYVLKLQKEGYGDVIQKVQVTAQKQNNCNILLYNTKLLSVITGGNGDEVFIDDEYQGKTPLRVKITYGEHSFYALRNGRKSSDVNVEVNRRTTKIDIPIEAEAIDLGLSVKWASYNLGAQKSSDIGLVVGWGKMPNDKAEIQFAPEEICGNVKYDIASKMWGGDWRLPSGHEFEELIKNCHWEWTTEDGVPGYKLTSLINAKSIFLPITGIQKGTTKNYEDSQDGAYWSGSKAWEGHAYCMKFDCKTVGRLQYINGQYGLAIRPVQVSK